jgi:hypothetical protein
LLSTMLPALAQSEAPQFRSDAEVEAFGSFATTSFNNGVRTATSSVGEMGTYRFMLNPFNGLEVNVGHTENTVFDAVAAPAPGIKTASYESTAAYVFRYPTHRFIPFFLAGGGALVFDPSGASALGAQARGALIYGGGADVEFSARFFLRAEFQGLLCRNPTFGVPGLSGNTVNRAQPSLGFGFRF